MILTKDKIIYLARVADYNNCEEVMVYWDEKLREINEEEMLIRYLGFQQAWFNTKSETRDKIIEFKKEIDEEETKKMRMEYLEWEIREIFSVIKDLKKDKKTLEMFLWDDELQKAEKKYKTLYIEYATLKANWIKNDKITDDVIQKCREVPVETLIPSHQMKDVGGGRLMTTCPFHDEQKPSFFVFPDNSWHCFGCSAHGQNAIDIVIKLRDTGFYEAVKYLEYYI